MWSFFLLNTTSYFIERVVLSWVVWFPLMVGFAELSKRWICFFPYWALPPPLYELQRQHLCTVMLYQSVNCTAVPLAPTQNMSLIWRKIAAHHFGIYLPWLCKCSKWVPINFSYWATCSFVIDFCCDICELSHVLFCTFLLSLKKQHQWCRCFDEEFRFIECLSNVLFTLSKINTKKFYQIPYYK